MNKPFTLWIDPPYTWDGLELNDEYDTYQWIGHGCKRGWQTKQYAVYRPATCSWDEKWGVGRKYTEKKTLAVHWGGKWQRAKLYRVT